MEEEREFRKWVAEMEQERAHTRVALRAEATARDCLNRSWAEAAEDRESAALAMSPSQIQASGAAGMTPLFHTFCSRVS